METPLSTALENGAIDQWLKTRRQEGVLTEDAKHLKPVRNSSERHKSNQKEHSVGFMFLQGYEKLFPNSFHYCNTGGPNTRVDGMQ